MIVKNLNLAAAFTTKDGSTIRSLLDATTAPVQNQSLAEATIAPGASTTRHRHARSEEIYYITHGQAEVDLEGQRQKVGVGDAILIPPGQAHKIWNIGQEALRLLCCCSPVYDHQDTELLE